MHCTFARQAIPVWHRRAAPRHSYEKHLSISWRRAISDSRPTRCRRNSAVSFLMSAPSPPSTQRSQGGSWRFLEQRS